MGREQTLLDRIAQGGNRGRARAEATTAEDLEALMESVRRHLTRLLNARHGLSETVPDYGLPALVDITVGSGNHVQAVLDAIKMTIEKYEPRLRRVRVTPQTDEEKKDHQKLVFRVEASLVGRSGEHRVWYETSLSGSGTFDVMA